MTLEDRRGDDGPAADSYKHEALRRLLQADIARMRPDEALPTERQLAERCNVSRATARRALQAPREDGLIRSVRGVGTFVSHPKIAKMSTLTSFSEDLRSRGYHPSAEVLAAELVEADPHHATALGVDPGTALHRIERLRLGDDFPICLETVCLSAQRFPDLDESLLKGSLVEYGESLCRGDLYEFSLVVTRAA